MSGPLSGAVLAVAVRCLPAHRREWGMAMEAELAAAGEDGRALPFALGCLAVAVGAMTADHFGRRILVGHAFALFVLLPAAALLLASLLYGVPVQTASILPGRPSVPGALNEGNVAALPGLALLVLLLVGGHLRLAWMIVERDWARVTGAAMCNAAAAATLVAAAGALVLNDARVLVQAALVMFELAAVCALVRWHDRPPWPAGAEAT